MADLSVATPGVELSKLYTAIENPKLEINIIIQRPKPRVQVPSTI